MTGFSEFVTIPKQSLKKWSISEITSLVFHLSAFWKQSRDKPRRYEAHRSHLDILRPASQGFCKWNWKQKLRGGCQSDWVKRALMSLLKSAQWPQTKAVAHHPFFYSVPVSAAQQRAFSMTSDHLRPSKAHWAVPWLTCPDQSSREKRKRLKQQTPRGWSQMTDVRISLWNTIEYSLLCSQLFRRPPVFVLFLLSYQSVFASSECLFHPQLTCETAIKPNKGTLFYIIYEPTFYT